MNQCLGRAEAVVVFVVVCLRCCSKALLTISKCSMYGIFTDIWNKFMVNVGKYYIFQSHGASGICLA